MIADLKCFRHIALQTTGLARSGRDISPAQRKDLTIYHFGPDRGHVRARRDDYGRDDYGCDARDRGDYGRVQP